MVKRRRAPGKNGGQPVRRDFSFAPADGEKYPSESESIRKNRLPKDPNHQQAWAWALSKMKTENAWLVVRIDGADEDARREYVRLVRASLWRAARRRQVQLVSEYVAPYLYAAVVD